MMNSAKVECDCLIHGLEWAITVDRERRMISDAAIAIQGGRIVAIGKMEKVLGEYTSTHRISGEKKIALPGLIDCGVFSTHHFGRGLGDDCDMYDFHLNRRASYEAALSAEDAYWSSLASQAEMLRSGTTCFVEGGSRFPLEVARACQASGIRAFASYGVCDVEEPFFGAPSAPMHGSDMASVVTEAAAAAEAIRRSSAGRIKPAVSVPWLAASSDRLLEIIAEAKTRFGDVVLASAAFCRDDAVASRRQYGRTEVDRLKAAGLLGPTSLLRNAGWASPSDMKTLLDTRTNVVCTPSASYRLGTGSLEFGRYPELLAFGVNIAFGSESAMASNYTDIIRQMFLFCGGNMSLKLDATVTPPEDAVEIGTIRAARALNMEHEVGSLEVGKKADISLFNVLQTDWIPLHNPLANLAFSTRGGAHTVLVDGQVVLFNGRLSNIDTDDLFEECRGRAASLAARSGLAKHGNSKWRVS